MIDIIRSAAKEVPSNPNSKKGFERLNSSVKWSYKKLEPFRVARKSLIDTYTGGSYGDGGDSGSVPLNMMELAISIYQRKLASHTPQVLITSPSHSLKPAAAELELAINHIIGNKLDLGTRLNEWVMDALFSVGIMKVGRTNKFEPRPLGFNSNGVNVYAEVIGLEDWVHDMTARRFEDVEFCGHMFNVTIEELMENPEYSKEAKEIAWSSVRNNNAYGYQFGDYTQRPETLSSEDSWTPDNVEDKVDLWEWYLPRTGEMAISFVDHEGAPLYVGEYRGPDHGPYTMLGYSKVPGNVKPLAPAEIWEDLSNLVNSLFLKAGDQADRTRTILVGANRSASDMDKIIHTADGETVLTDHDPNNIKEFRFGGVDQGLMGAVMQFKEFFSYQAGNLDALGGLGAMSDTIGQDQMLKGGANERLADMQDITVKQAVKVIRDIAWHVFEEEQIDLDLTKQITPNISRDFRWNKHSKDGEFLDYNFNIVPYSLQSRSPQERLQTLNMVVQQTILPAMPLLEAQGLTFDMKKYLECVAKLSSTEEINDLIRDSQGEVLNQQTSTEPKSAAVTQRNYTRTNLPNPDASKNDAMQMMQKAMQPSGQNMQQGRGRPAAAR